VEEEDPRRNRLTHGHLEKRPLNGSSSSSILSSLYELCFQVESVPGLSRTQPVLTGCVKISRVQLSTGQRSYGFH